MTKPEANGYSLRVARIVVRLANHWPDDALEVQTKEPVPVSKLSSVPVTGLHQIAVEYDGSGKASGIKFFVSGKQVETEVLKDHLRGSFRTTALLQVGDKSLGTAFEGAMDDLRIYNRTLSANEVEDLAVRLPARSLLQALGGRPDSEIATLQPPKDDDVQIGMEDSAKTKEETEKALEKSRQAKLSEYFLKYAAPEKERQLYSQLIRSAKRKKTSWKRPFPRS